MKSYKKAQAALEFLTTYGWAILVVLVMIGALAYFGVLNPSKFAAERCVFSGPEMTCQEAKFTRNPNTIEFTLINNMPYDYIILKNNFNYTIRGVGSGPCDIGGSDITIPKDGGKETITCTTGTDIGNPGDKKAVVLNFFMKQYGGNLNMSKSLDIVATVQ